MADKHVKKFPTWYVIREMQTKATRHCYRLIRMAKSKTLTASDTGEDVERQVLSLTAGRNANGTVTLVS